MDRKIALTKAITREPLAEIQLGAIHVGYLILPNGGSSIITIQPGDLAEDMQDFLLARCKESFEYVAPEPVIDPVESKP